VVEAKGSDLTVPLYQAFGTPIQRHTKIKGEANPYDLVWEPYFEARLGVKLAQTLAGRKLLLWLWKEQNGICPVCGQKITALTGWHNHHLQWRSLGGSDAASNRVLLPHIAPSRFTARASPSRNRVLPRALARLELHEGELSRAVLRGGGDGNVTSLPDP
jgi:hypothetical protein